MIEILYWVGGVLILLLVCLFVLPVLFLPNQLVFRTKIQRTEKIKRIAMKLRGKTKEETLKNVYNYVLRNYEGVDEKYKLAWLPGLFLYDVDKIVDKRRFLACHIQNLVLRTLLLNTGQFSEDEIARKQTISWFLTTHQYLIVDFGKVRYKIDPFFKVIRKI